MTETWAWISGWAIQPERFQSVLEKALPGTQQIVLHPGPDAVDQILSTNAQRIGGYSLGSLLLLNAFEQIPKNIPLVCMAPILGFCLEDQLGGTTSKESLDKLRSRLHARPSSAIQLFYRLAKLHDEPTEALPYCAADLDWGLKMLSETTVDKHLDLSRVEAWIGREDPLIQSNVIAPYFERRHITPSLHAYKDLAEHLASAAS